MYGDTRYEWVMSGSTTASAATAHSLFGTYNGLSSLNSGDVLHLQVLAGTNNVELLRTSGLTTGFSFPTGASVYYDLPPISLDAASQMHFRDATGASGASVRWNIWRRIG